jgi:RHS repeat-associated protein
MQSNCGSLDLFKNIQKNINDSAINFMWEGDNLSLELNATNQPIRKYFTENGMDDYFAHLEYSEITDWGQIFQDFHPQGWYGYIKDHVGTIYKVWDHNAHQVSDNRSYDSFGNLVSQTGTTRTPLGFQGKYYDQESGLNYFYNRYYNPVVGRFINEDPIRFEGGDNFYSFGKNNSIMNVDLYGLKCKRISKWRASNAFSSNEKGILINSFIQNFFILYHEEFAISKSTFTVKYNCDYRYGKSSKISIYQKKRLMEADFECTDNCITRIVTKQENHWTEYSISEPVDYIGPQTIRISSIICLPVLIK